LGQSKADYSVLVYCKTNPIGDILAFKFQFQQYIASQKKLHRFQFLVGTLSHTPCSVEIFIGTLQQI